MKKNIRLYLAVSLIIFKLNTIAYADAADLKLKDAKFVIEKNIAISLPEEQQIFTNTDFIEKNAINLPKLDYNFDELDIDLGLLPPDFKILKAKQEILEKLYSSYIKIGHGASCDPILEFGYGNTYDPTLNYGAIFKHSSLGSLKSGYFSDFSLNAGHIYFSKYIKSLLIGADVKYRYDKFCFLADGPPPRYISSLDFLTHLKNYESSPLRYETDLEYCNTTIIDKNFGEHQISATGKITYRLTETRKLINDTKIFLSKYTNEEKSINRNCFETRTIDEFELWDFKFHYGAALCLDDNYFTEPIFINILCPVLGLEYDFRPWMRPYLNLIDTANKINSLRSVILENPYIKNNFTLYNEHGIRLGNYGIKGKIIDELSYNSGLAFYYYDVNLLYENADPIENTSAKENIYGCEFESKYCNSVYVKLYIEILYNSIDDKLRSSLELNGIVGVKSHTSNPSFLCNWLTTYKLSEKWLLKNNIYALAGHAYFEKNLKEAKDDIEKNRDDKPQKIYIDPIIDISIGADYFYTPRFVIFASIDNLLMRPNIRFHNTRSNNWIKITAGITYSFL